MDGMTQQLMDKLDLDSRGKPKWADEYRPRIEWEWRRVKRSFGSTERKRLVDELQQWNSALARCLEKQEIPLEDSTPMVQTLKACFNTNICNAVREQARQLKEVLDGCWQCHCARHHQPTLDLDWYAGQPTISPVFKVSLSYETFGSPSQPDSTKWQNTRMVLTEESAGRKRKDRDERSVLGPYVADRTAMPCPQLPSQIQKRHGWHLLNPSRVRWSQPKSSVAATLPADDTASGSVEITSLCRFIQDLEGGVDGLRSLPIPGAQRCIQITSLPKSPSTPINIVSLERFLSPNVPPSSLGLTLLRRYETAAAASWAVLLLCGTPWLNDRLSKDDLYFFLRQEVSNRELLSDHPCISRFHTQATNSVGASNSPEQFQGRSIRNMTIFALGILLIELCLGRTFEDLRRETTVGIEPSSIMDDYEVANDLVDRLVNLQAGDSYGYACQRCIRCEFPGRDATKDLGFEQFRKNFFSCVVAPVQATLSMIPP